MGWSGPMTHRQYLVWMEWVRMKYQTKEEEEAESLSMEGCVPEETQKRWADKIAGAKFQMLGARKRSEEAYQNRENQ